MQTKYLLTITVLVALVSGCATSTTGSEAAKPVASKAVEESPAAKASKAIAAAEAAQKKASSVEGEWRDTGEIIKQAKAAAEAGDVNKAIKLANNAREQGELGYQQAVMQQALQMPPYLKYRTVASNQKGN